MNCVLLIERDGQRNAVKLSLEDAETICVGRSWNSDVVVSDKYVDSEHLKISANDDKFLIEDLNSQNGTRLKKRVVKGEATFDFGDAIVVGETTLRLVDANDQVAPAVKYAGVSRMIRKIGIVKSVMLASLFSLLAFSSYMLWGQTMEVTTSKVVEDLAAFLMGLFSWVIVIGIVSKLFTKKTKFSLHLILACTTFTLVIIFGLIKDVVVFNLNPSPFVELLSGGIPLVILCLFLYGVLSLVTRFNKLYKVVWVAICCSTLVFLNGVAPKLAPAHEQWSSYTTISHTGQPPQFFIGKTVSLDVHQSKTENLFKNVGSE